MLEGIQTHPRDPQVAKNVHDDIWDLFGSLTRNQSAVLTEYLEGLTEAGVLMMPKMASTGNINPSAGQLKQPGDVPQPEPSADQTE